MSRGCIIALAGFLSMLQAGCAHLPAPDEVSREQLSFLQPEKVDQADLLLRFGDATGRFQGDRVLTWRLGRTSDGRLRPAARVVVLHAQINNDGSYNWGGTLLDLVAVFDDHQVLKQYRLVPVHGG